MEGRIMEEVIEQLTQKFKDIKEKQEKIMNAHVKSITNEYET